MFQIGQKIRLWKYYIETLQFLIQEQYMLTVTERRADGEYVGTLEDGSVYKFENGCWWAESAEGEARLKMAIHIWNSAMILREENMRVILLPKGEKIEPDGDVGKCEKHYLYYFSGHSCSVCRGEASSTIG